MTLTCQLQSSASEDGMVITRIILPFRLTRTCEARSLAVESEEDLPAAVSYNQLGCAGKMPTHAGHEQHDECRAF